LENTEDVSGQRFLWGSVLTSILFVPFIIGMCIGFFNAFRGVSEQKATGLGAISGSELPVLPELRNSQRVEQSRDH